MAPTRKSRSINKRFSFVNEVSPDKDVGNSSKIKQRKRKLSDKLGPQWTKAELQRFYEAYRKYGKDWKKIVAAVRHRSIDMVEALYNMNRAYLSLPEGTASVVGLIAMMTDHYNVMEGSGSERESNDDSDILQKPHKRKRAKVQSGFLKEDSLPSQSIASSDGCLSLLKRGQSGGSQPRAVGKRTPRFPVSYSHNKDVRENYIPPNKKARKLEVDANDDEVAHVAALALTEASQMGGSPQVSQTPYRSRAVHRRFSPVQSGERRLPKTKITQAKVRDASMSKDWLEGSVGIRESEYEAYARDSKSLMDMEGVGTVEIHRKGKKIYGKKVRMEEIGNDHSDDGGEACSGTEEGLKGCALKGNVDTEVSNAKSAQFSPESRKSSKKLLFGESSIQYKEERNNDEKWGVPEATSTSHDRDKTKFLGSKVKGHHSITGVEDIILRKSKVGTHSGADGPVVSIVKQQPQSINSTWKGKRKPLTSTVCFPEEKDNSLTKGKRTSQISAQSKQWKSSRVLDGTSIDSDQIETRINLAVSSAQVPAASLVNLPPKQQSRRKIALKRALTQVTKPSENILKNALNQYSISRLDGVICLKENLSCCLSSPLVRRWCTFEWFYSAIDYPWFAKREFVEYLNHVGLGHIPRLTRVEWGVIRSSLGKPRRFSERFLLEERDKLRKYRESVRKTYTELRTGIREGVPTDLARPLSVGQQVIAIHPKARGVHDGSVLTVDHDKCRIQFDRPEIGVEFVKDVDCMPLNPLDNMPEALRRQNISLHKLSEISKDPQGNGRVSYGGSMIFSPSGQQEIAPSPMNILVNKAKVSVYTSSRNIPLCSQQACHVQPLIGSHISSREADIRAISDVNRANAKRDALVMELRNVNNTMLEDQYNGDGSLKDSEAFKKHYAMVLVQLKEASEKACGFHDLACPSRHILFSILLQPLISLCQTQASSALLNLRQRNTHPGNPLSPWMKLPASATFLGGLTSSIDCSLASQESGSGVVEIVKGSRLKAHRMVDAAIQAVSLVKEGEDAFMRIGAVLYSLDKRQQTSDNRVPVMRSPEQFNGSLGRYNQLVCGTSEPMIASPASPPDLYDDSVKNEALIPSELITSCVATLLMIQSCTERQYPPADVAQIIDSAVTSLHPCSLQNLPIYREIQMCMGRIKTQILALIPT
ncbi:LOW QUALITY PROTEIN: DIRP domain-containing protein [Cephalotus follicularis]|uniref:DIRP domain-containing protein n=1 Tax=Cephalotus follicularis TaxID=3775 RepID=A0A1Q3B5E3_CEPFO|nr:LOW QUALITY PROTEIN: DIRP domain-containing protein [Cephalotus follicularis]